MARAFMWRSCTRPGIWHERRLQEPYTDQDIALEWKKPFPAKWRANFCFQRQSDSWDFQDHESETWMYLYQAMVWPCWFDGDRRLRAPIPAVHRA